MKSLFISFLTVFFMVQVSSAKMTRLKHAHNHGSAKLGLAFEDKNGRLDFKVDSGAVIGFEHEAKSESQKKTVETQLALFESKIGEMVVFAPELACSFTKEKVVLEKEVATGKKSKGEHSDLVAVFNITCAKSPAGSKITFNFQKLFPKIHDIDTAVIAGDLQKSLKIKKSGSTIELVK